MKLLRLLCCDRIESLSSLQGNYDHDDWFLSWLKLQFPLWLLFSAIINVAVSVLIMYSIADLIVSFNNNELHIFVIAVWKTLALVTVQAIATALKTYFADCSAIQWRNSLNRELLRKITVYHKLVRNWDIDGVGNKSRATPPLPQQERSKKYFSGFSANVLLYNENLDGLDQRLSQDIIDFTIKAASLYEKVIVLPAIILFYTGYIYMELGLLSVILCLLYFLFGSSLSLFIAKSIAPLVYQQAKLEAIFRYSCTSYMKQLATIVFIGGGEREIEKMLKFFQEAISNKMLLVTKELWVRVSTQWFAYAGSVVSYSIVGFSILFPIETQGFAWTASAKTDFTVKNARLKAWSKGSYACMSLINAFSTAVDTVTLFSEAQGLFIRIEQLSDGLDLVTSSIRAANGDAQCMFTVPTPLSHGTTQSTSFGGATTALAKFAVPFVWMYRRFVVRTNRGTAHRNQYHDLLTSYNTMFFDEALDAQYDLEGECDELGQTPSLRAPLVTASMPSLPLTHLNSPSQMTTLQSSNNNIRDDIILEVRDYRLFTLDQTKVILPSLSLTVKKGMRILITGPTGCGKSTLLQIIATMIRQLHCKEENNVPFGSQARLEVCSQVPYILHQGTVRENLLYPYTVNNGIGTINSTNATDREAWALKSAMLEDFILKLTELSSNLSYLDIHTMDGSNGQQTLSVCERMSTGQRQCLSIARLLYHANRNTVALLDEATSGMDEFTEEEVYKAIVHNIPTIISVGHRSSVRKFHSHELNIRKDGTYSFVSIQ